MAIAAAWPNKSLPPITTGHLRRTQRSQEYSQQRARITRALERDIIQRYESGQSTRRIAVSLSPRQGNRPPGIEERQCPEAADWRALLIESGWIKATRPSPAVPGHVRKLPASEVAREAYDAGATVYELADAFKIHRTTVSQHVLRSGVIIRQQGLSQDQVATAAIRLYQQGWSLARLGDEFGVGAETVHTALRQDGVPMRKPWERV